jgi:acyl-CoA synthetase (AMP-forming)/AMP-acid ligase II
MNITEPLRRHANLRPHTPAVIRPTGDTVSYGDLDRTIDALAARFLECRLEPGNVASLLIPNEYPLLLVSLALARAGIASGPPGMPDALVDVQIAYAGAPVADHGRVLAIDPGWLETPPADVVVPPVPCHPGGTATCIIIGSSGTTGTPKYVALSHEMLHQRILVKRQLAPLPDAPRHISVLGPGGGYGFRETLRVLWAGGLVVLTTTPKSVVESIARYGVNYMVASPGALKVIVEALPKGHAPFPSLRSIEVGGCLLPPRLYRAARRHVCAHIVSSYGATETGSLASAPMETLEGRSTAVGFLAPGVEVEAVDDNDRSLPAGSEGVLRIRGETCVHAYLGNPADSAEVFRNGWFYPGDVGSVSVDGLLSITGRTSEFINAGGTKVSPQVIEEVLLALDPVVDAAAFGVPDGSGLMQIWAAIVAEGPVDGAVLSARCRERLHERAPRHIVKVGALPRNEGGKVVRGRLVEMVMAARNRTNAKA